MGKPLIFISCGQVNGDEIQLGNQIQQFIREKTQYDAYFAEKENTLQGLVENIFGALDRSSALIAVMHRRGDVTNREGKSSPRGSVWVEQEIAIASFLLHSLKRPFEVGFFVQRGIPREGVRTQLRLAPIDFEQSDEVLPKVMELLPTWNLRPRRTIIAEGPLRESANVVEMAEDALTAARVDVGTATTSSVFGDKAHVWTRLQRMSLDAVENIQRTHYRVSRALLDLRIAAQPIEGVLSQIAGGIASRSDQSKARNAFREQAEKLDAAIAAARNEIEKAAG